MEFKKKLDNQHVKEKETATFECELNRENLKVKWFKGGLEIIPNDKFTYLSNGTKYSLKISDCQLDDINDYSILVRGRKCSASLEVEGN